MVTVAAFAGATLASPAGLSRLRMIADGMPYGGIRSSYRTPAEQQYLYDGWVRRLPGFNFALPPSKSKHVQGTALDMIVTSAAHKWMLTHAAAYGWHRTALPQEPWHWEYTGATPTTTGEDMLTPEDLEAIRGMIYNILETNRGQIAISNRVVEGVNVALEQNRAQLAMGRNVWDIPTITRDGQPVSLRDVVAQTVVHSVNANAKADQVLEALDKIPGVDPASLATDIAEAMPAPVDNSDVVADKTFAKIAAWFKRP